MHKVCLLYTSNNLTLNPKFLISNFPHQRLVNDDFIGIKIEIIKMCIRDRGDYAKLSRILVNLVNNAFKYSAPGTKLEVVAKLEKNQLSISVTDEGQGIAPEDLENIFKRLYRVETSRNMKTGGHGDVYKRQI